MTIDGFDIFAFVVFAVLLAAAVVIVVMLGALPGKIAATRGHPYAAAVNAAAWISLVTLGALWPIALVWAFLPWPAARLGGDLTGKDGRPHPMIAFITIIYVLAIVLVFKVFRVRPRPWPIALFVVVGILMIGGIVVSWTLAAPISERAVVTRYVIQVVPWVKGKVLSISARPNVPLKRDSLLFQIDPAPFQDTVNQARGQLDLAESNVLGLRAATQVAAEDVSGETNHKIHEAHEKEK